MWPEVEEETARCCAAFFLTLAGRAAACPEQVTDTQRKKAEQGINHRLAELERGATSGEEALEGGYYPDVLWPL
jgi:hypothetical protein